MKSFMKCVCLIVGVGLFTHMYAMETKGIQQASQVKSLQELSTAEVVNLLVSFIEQEANGNNNNTNDLPLRNLRAFVRLYVPDTIICFEQIWQNVFVRLVESSQISPHEKIVLIKNHITNGSLQKCNALSQMDIIDWIIKQFQNTGLKDARALKTFIMKAFDLTENNDWDTEFFLSAAHKMVHGDNLFTTDQKYVFIQSLIADKDALGLKPAQIEDFLYDIATVLRDHALQRIDANNTPFVIVHQIDSAATAIAKLAQLNDQKRRAVMADIFCALMLSDRFTITQKEAILDEMLKSFGRALTFHQARSIFNFIKKYSKNDDERLSVNSSINTESGSTTLLHLATIKLNSNPILVKQLIQLNANVNATDGQGRTALYNAVALGSRDGVKLLLSKGARADIKDCNNQTPLHMFLENLNHVIVMDDVIEFIVDKLITCGAPLNQHDNNGNTPLALWRNLTGLSPAFKKNIEDLLIQHGAI